MQSIEPEELDTHVSEDEVAYVLLHTPAATDFLVRFSLLFDISDV